jgi:ATP synthase protein I
MTESPLRRVAAARARRKQRARGDTGVWFSLGMMGLVGWSVAVPTIIGVIVGVWIDRTWPSRVSWTLTLLLAGVALGCLNAWRWVRQESANGTADRDGSAGAAR